MRKLLLTCLVIAACKGGGGKPESKAIGDSGFVVDAPASWSVKTDMKDFYTVAAERKHDGWVQVMVGDGSGAASLDDLVKSAGCDDAGKAIKETTPAGTLYVQCEGTGAMIDDKAIKVTKIVAEAKNGDRHASCHMDTDHEVDVVAAVCKSLRKK